MHCLLYSPPWLGAENNLQNNVSPMAEKSSLILVITKRVSPKWAIIIIFQVESTEVVLRAKTPRRAFCFLLRMTQFAIRRQSDSSGGHLSIHWGQKMPCECTSTCHVKLCQTIPLSCFRKETYELEGHKYDSMQRNELKRRILLPDKILAALSQNH